MLVVQFLDGQYDQRADSAMQCVQFLTGGVRPVVKCAEVYVFKGVTDAQFEKSSVFSSIRWTAAKGRRRCRKP